MHNVKRIIVSGLLAHVAGFVVGGGILLLFGAAEVTNMSEMPKYIWYIGMATTAAIMYVASKWYFGDVTVMPGALSGFIYGFWVLAISFVLDALVLLPQLFVVGIRSLIPYYSDPYFLLTILVLLVTPAVVGWSEEKRRPRPGIITTGE